MSDHLMITQELQRLDARARGAAAQVMQAQEIAQVLRLGELHPPAWVRPLARTVPGVRSLELAVRDRLQALVREQLRRVRELPPENRLERLRVLEHRDWQVLRGAQAWVLSWALREAEQLRLQITREIPGVPLRQGQS